MQISLKKHNLPGQLIAVCGADGTGKSTLVNMLFKILKGRTDDENSIICLKQPSSWWNSDRHVQRTILLKGDAKVFDELALGVFGAADRINQQAMVIESALSANQTVLVDRYVYCLLAYFIAKSEPRINYLASICEPLFQPDFTFVLHCPPEIAIDRVIKRDGPNPARSDQQLAPTSDFNEAYRVLANYNGFHMLSSLESPTVLLRKVLDRLRLT
jgi:thymidylate kinase